MTGLLTEETVQTKKWEDFLDILEEKMPLIKPWLPALEPVCELNQKSENGIFLIKSSQPFAIQFLQTKHKQDIEKTLEEFTGFKQSVAFVLDETIKKKKPKKQTTEEKEHLKTAQRLENLAQMHNFCGLNLKYTFENFVEGENSHFAYSVAKMIAEAPGQKYNPLFISGSVGVGKTHLMQAIGHKIMRNFPNLKIRYTNAEEFGNKLIESLSSSKNAAERNDKMKKFRDTYRNADVLLIDDIQWIEGKDRTAEEIFNTFNALHYAGKQIVFASDRPLSAFELIPDRLKSRFEWGIEAHIKVPNLNTRFEIVKNHAKASNFPISDDVALLLAQEFDRNVRELEGAYNKISAIASIDGIELDVENTKELLGLNEKKKKVTIDNILDICAKYFNVERSDILSAARAKDIVLARKFAIYFAREILDLSYPKMAQEFKKNHTTILYQYDNLKKELSLDKALDKKAKEIKELIFHA